jgi:hypothetical protein
MKKHMGSVRRCCFRVGPSCVAVPSHFLCARLSLCSVLEEHPGEGIIYRTSARLSLSGF